MSNIEPVRAVYVAAGIRPRHWAAHLGMASIVLSLLGGAVNQAQTCGDEPICGLPVVDVVDHDSDGDYDQDDILDAMEDCEPGCNLHFLAQTYYDVAIQIGVNDPSAGEPDYFPDGFSMYGEGQGKTVLRLPVYDLDDEASLKHLIHVGRHAPDGIFIQDLTLDGVKDEIAPPTTISQPWTSRLNLIVAIYVGYVGANDTRYDGTIRRVEIKDFLSIGIELRDVDGWTIADNDVHDLGCHVTDCTRSPFYPYPVLSCDGDEPCGTLWHDQIPDVSPAAPNRKAFGYGIGVGVRSTDVVVEDNEVYNCTYSGITTYLPHETGMPANCNAAGVPTDTTIRNNYVHDSRSGIYVNGGCRTTIDGNTAEGMRSTGMPPSEEGWGIGCTDGGEGTIWRNNISKHNQGPGYRINCGGDNLLFEDNYSEGNCQRCDPAVGGDACNVGQGDVDFNANLASVPVARGVTITGHSFASGNPGNCKWGISIAEYADVALVDGMIDGGLHAGLRVVNSCKVDVASIDIRNSPRGVFFQKELARTYVQDSVTFENVTTDFDWSWSGGEPGDGDDIAACEWEDNASPPDPQGCENLDNYQATSCDFCPAPVECSIPPSCLNVDTGMTRCYHQGTFDECPPGTSIHLAACDCNGGSGSSWYCD